ncbi:MAG: V-type ATP synthase subunit K [Candidatus Hydrogenedentes bacterium]|nr:V-type ATP synthase subunit K [Candidatus Hydrogenedentota bacterium]
MVTGRFWKTLGVVARIIVLLALLAPWGVAAEEAESVVEEQVTMSTALRTVGLAFAAAIAIAAAALATARVQAAIGSGGTGALAEKPELFVPILVLIAIPETLVVFGFVIAVLLWQLIG